MPEGEPFKDREDVKADIRQCAWVGGIIMLASLGCAALGVIGDAFNITLVLESTSWFLLAIVVGLISLVPNMRSSVAKHLYGIEEE